MYFRYYRLGKSRLDICLKSPVSEESFIGKMVNRSKNCCNLNGSTVAIFYDTFEGK